MTEITKKSTQEEMETKPLNDLIKLLAWSVHLSVAALFALGKFALQQGGKVEFQFGPLIYRVYGSREK